MTFRLADPEQLYRTPVTVEVPAGDGQTEKHTCVLLFRLVDSSRARELALEGDAAYIRGVVGGWEEIAAADGSPLEFNGENVGTLASIPYFVRSVVDAYARFSAGLPLKNSEAPLSTGLAREAARTKSKPTPERSALN